MTIYDNVKALAEAKGLSIRQVEQQAGIANGAIGKWREDGRPYAETLQKVAVLLEVSMEELMKCEP